MESKILTGTLTYKEIEFSFVFDTKLLRLIPPEDKRDEIGREWYMHKISENLWAIGIDDKPVMEDPLLIGKCNEDGSTIVFITKQGAPLRSEGPGLTSVSIIYTDIAGYIIRKHGEYPISEISFMGPELDRIYPTGQSYTLLFNEEDRKKGVIDIQTHEFDSTISEPEFFEVESKKIKATFGTSRTLSFGVAETPLKLNSTLTFTFEETNNYIFIYKLWQIAKRFLQFLCYRQNTSFTKVELLALGNDKKPLAIDSLYVLDSMDEPAVSSEELKKDRYIKYQYIKGYIGTILHSISNNTLYLRHLPKTYKDGLVIDAARFIAITAAFEWEFRRVFPKGIKKKPKRIEAESTVEQIINREIEENTGEVRRILKYLFKNIKNDPLASKLTYVGKELGGILDVFGDQLYKYNHEELKYSAMGERLATQRNDFAHGNLDKDFTQLALLDLLFLERIIYAMQLKFYGIKDINIKKAINDLFQDHIMISE